jgi:hypothetical protein
LTTTRPLTILTLLPAATDLFRLDLVTAPPALLVLGIELAEDNKMARFWVEYRTSGGLRC